MGNQNRKNAIRAYMAEHGVNYTTAKRAIDSIHRLDPVSGELPDVGGATIDLSDPGETPVGPMKYVAGGPGAGKSLMNWLPEFEAGTFIVGICTGGTIGQAGAPASIDLHASGITLIDGPFASGKSTLLDQFREGVRQASNVEIIADFTDYAHAGKDMSVQDVHAALDRVSAALDDTGRPGLLRLVLVDDLSTWIDPDSADGWTSTTDPRVRPLAEEVEEVRARLSALIAAIARKGRSLGVHAILSTHGAWSARVLAVEVRSLIGARIQLQPNGSRPGTALLSTQSGPVEVIVSLPFPPGHDVGAAGSSPLADRAGGDPIG